MYEYKIAYSAITIFLIVVSIQSVPVMQGTFHVKSTATVSWYHEDAITGGDWLFNPVGSPIGKYGSYAYILPNAPATMSQIPVGAFSVPIGFDLSNPSTWPLLADPPYNWTNNQILGLSFYRPDPVYWDGYWSISPPVPYYVNGTQLPPHLNSINYPVFEWAWDNWHTVQTDPREVYYPTPIPGTGGGPGWRLCCWNDGGERCSPDHGYMNFTLHFPQGSYLLSLYAYDYERDARYSQIYRIYDETGVLLTSVQIEGAVFDNGVYEGFKVVAPTPGGLTMTVQVYNDAGHAPEPIPPDRTSNVVLSGIFVDELMHACIMNVIPSKTVVGQGYSMNITVTVQNQGDFEESFNVSVFYDDTVITLPDGKNHTTTTLPSGNATTLTFTWNTTNVGYGNYTISAFATPVLGETYTSDNTLIDGWVVITIPGDITGDYTVDHKDLLLLASAYGSEVGEPRYIPEADIDGSGKVDHKDLLILAANYGKEA